MSEVTYGQLETALRALGFSLWGLEEKNKVYRHEATGALVVFPEFPPDSPVLPYHLLSTKSILQAYGIADSVGFTSELHQAS
jgi:hypothetical protein